MSVAITSKDPCACCIQAQTKIGTNSQIGYTASSSFGGTTIGGGSLSVSFTNVVALGQTVSLDFVLDYNAGTEISLHFCLTLTSAFIDNLFSFCAAQVFALATPLLTGSGTYSGSIAFPPPIPPGPAPVFPYLWGTIVSEDILTTDTDVNGNPIDMPLLSTWVFGDGPVPQFNLLFLVADSGSADVCSFFSSSAQQTVAVDATISNVTDGPNEAMSWAVGTDVNDLTSGCADTFLGGNGVFSFQACRITFPLTGLLVGRTYQLSVPVLSRAHGTEDPFVPAGTVVGTFVAPSASYQAPWHLGWPMGFNYDVIPLVGEKVLTLLP